MPVSPVQGPGENLLYEYEVFSTYLWRVEVV